MCSAQVLLVSKYSAGQEAHAESLRCRKRRMCKPGLTVCHACAAVRPSQVVENIGSSIQKLELSVKWCLNLQKELETVAYQSPLLHTLQVTVTEPDDPRWETQVCGCVCVSVCVCVCICALYTLHPCSVRFTTATRPARAATHRWARNMLLSSSVCVCVCVCVCLCVCVHHRQRPLTCAQRAPLASLLSHSYTCVTYL